MSLYVRNLKFARMILILALLAGMLGLGPVQFAYATDTSLLREEAINGVMQTQIETAVMVKDIYPGSVGSLGNVFKSVNGTLYFGASDGVNGSGLWRSDGTADGTVLVKAGFATAVQYLESANGILYFATNDGVSGSELWKSDGTLDGTVLVKDIRPGSSGSFPSSMTNVNGIVYFKANNGTNGIELWKSDGTADGTVLVTDIVSGGGSPNIDNLRDVNGTLFFTANDGSHGNELWKSDGTSAGTVMVKDLYPGFPGTSYYELTNVNGIVYFSASNDVSGYELWKSNGTEAGTVLVRDIWGGTNSSYPDSFENVNGTLFFTASNGVNGNELWKSNGTSAGTVMVKDIWPGSSGWGSDLTHVGNIVYFGANDGVNARLWKSDGTSVGTVKINAPAPLDIGNANGFVYYSGSDGVNGYELWRSDGTTSGTVLVKDINPSGDSYPDLFFDANGTLYFRANDGVHGTELWKITLVDSSTPSPTPTSTPTSTPTATPTHTPTATPAIPSGLVVNTNDSGPGSLRQAIMDILPDGIITFDPSMAGQTIALTSEINLDKNLTIDGSGLNPGVEISGNLTSQIFHISFNSTVTLQSLTFKDGRNNSGGGAIYNDGNLTVIDSTFSNNSTTGDGGAIYNNQGQTVNVSKSTFVNNSAQNGGAIYIHQSLFSNGVSSNIVNNTFVGNQANTTNGSGGGIYSAIDSGFGMENLFILANNTFSANGAYSGGNLYNLGSMSFNNNIFANNTSGGDCYSIGSISPIVVYGLNNLIEDGVPCSQGTFISGDPLLGTLADNGGRTMTMALLPDSPAIDAGTTCVFEDQRGVFRPQGNYCDIGAYEYIFPPIPTPTNTPTLTPTPSSTPISNCNAVYHGTLTSSGELSMDVTNQTGNPLLVQNVMVTWNNDHGHLSGSDKTLRLQAASLNGLSFWNGDVEAPAFTITPADLFIPAGTSTIRFTFHQFYDVPDGSERILITLATNGCQANPIDSDSAAVTHTPTVTPTHTPTDTPTNTATFTPTNTPTLTPTPAVFTLVLQPDAAAGQDSYIYNGSKNANFGNAVDMGVGEDNNANNRFARSLIKFDLSSIPSNASINSATLSLWTNADLSDNTRTIRVYRLKMPFNETQATWNLAAIGTSWQTAGASGANDRENTAIGSVTILNNETLNIEKQIALTPDKIQEMLSGTFVNRGFIIVADTESNDRFNYKTSDSTSSTQRPKLVIQYTVPSVTPSGTPVPTGTPTQVPSVTSTSTRTPTATFTASVTPTNQPTNTPTWTPTSTFTVTATATRTPSPTSTATTSSGFPITVVRDNFNRANGAIGTSWSGYPAAFAISSNQLDVLSSGSNTYIFWNSSSFGADQEAYVTFTQIDTTSNEQRLILKSQSSKSSSSGLISILYDGAGQNVQVWTYHPTQGWVQYGTNIPVTFANGDQFGARAKPDGTVEIYRNGTLLATRNITSWPFYANSGYVGLWLVNAPNALLDNFGGGTR